MPSEQTIGAEGNQENFVAAINKPSEFQRAKGGNQSSEKMQLSFFQLNDPVLENIKEELQKTDINTLTPIEALMKLNEIKKMIGG